MAELKEYQKRMGYDEGKMKSMKYKMVVYDEFLRSMNIGKNIMVKKIMFSQKRNIGKGNF